MDNVQFLCFLMLPDSWHRSVLCLYQIDAFYASIILFVGRAWDGITDPTVGFLVSRSPWTRFGRMLPW